MGRGTRLLFGLMCASPCLQPGDVALPRVVPSVSGRQVSLPEGVTITRHKDGSVSYAGMINWHTYTFHSDGSVEDITPI